MRSERIFLGFLKGLGGVLLVILAVGATRTATRSMLGIDPAAMQRERTSQELNKKVSMVPYCNALGEYFPKRRQVLDEVERVLANRDRNIDRVTASDVATIEKSVKSANAVPLPSPELKLPNASKLTTLVDRFRLSDEEFVKALSQRDLDAVNRIQESQQSMSQEILPLIEEVCK